MLMIMQDNNIIDVFEGWIIKHFGYWGAVIAGALTGGIIGGLIGAFLVNLIIK